MNKHRISRSVHSGSLHFGALSDTKSAHCNINRSAACLLMVKRWIISQRIALNKLSLLIVPSSLSARHVYGIVNCYGPLVNKPIHRLRSATHSPSIVREAAWTGTVSG